MMRDEAPCTDNPGTAGDDCRSGTRNRYFRGKTMRADDFEKEQRYLIGRRRLITRSVLGWGVVYGLPVDAPRRESHRHDESQPEQQNQTAIETEPNPPIAQAEPKCPEAGPISVGSGFALDRHGREIDIRGKRKLDANNTFILAKEGDGWRTKPAAAGTPRRYLLSIHYAERRFGDVKLPDGCNCHEPDKKYVCETAVFSLKEMTTRRCPCGEKPCDRHCKCGASSTCRGGRGPHACLCEWTVENAEYTDERQLCEWGGYSIDPTDGVPLACVVVEVRQGECELEIVGCVEDGCSPRRIVKNNDLLYDLIRGCDLAHISWISWAHWHRRGDVRMQWDDFEAMFKADGWTNFVVRFSGPVLTETLKRDVIAIAVITREPGTGWRILRRIPILELDLTPHSEPPAGYSALPEGTTNQMRVLVRPRWVKDEVEKGGESWLGERQFRIEVEIYGDYILDCHGQAIDANAVGLRPVPTGNGTPGGTYRSNFRVEPQQRPGRDRDEA
jgi:hypothetical protein